MKILLTAFDAFGGEKTNAALEALNKITAPPGISLCKLTVPTVFGRCIDTVVSHIRYIQPDAVICVGQAAGRRAVTPERIAVNLMDARIPDNEGFLPVDQPIDPSGPAAYFSTLPVKAMRDAIRKEGIPSELSCSAGTFVCNDLMYGVLHSLSSDRFPIPAGFIHIPCTPEQAALYPSKTPSLYTEDAVRALYAALLTMLSD